MSFESVQRRQSPIVTNPAQPFAEQGYRLIHNFRGANRYSLGVDDKLDAALNNLFYKLQETPNKNITRATLTKMVTDKESDEPSIRVIGIVRESQIMNEAQRGVILACLFEQLEQPNVKYDAKQCADGWRIRSFIQKAEKRELPSFEEDQKALEEDAHKKTPEGKLEIAHQIRVFNYQKEVFRLEKGAQERNWKEFSKSTRVELCQEDLRLEKVQNNEEFLALCESELKELLDKDPALYTPNKIDYMQKLLEFCASLKAEVELTPELIKNSKVFVQLGEGDQERTPKQMGLKGICGLFADALFRFSKLEPVKKKVKSEFDEAAQKYAQLNGPKRNVIEWPKEFEQAEKSGKKESPSLFGRVGNAIVGFLSSCKEKLMNFWRWLWGSNGQA